jgi:UDP-glucose 4-epimerase
MLHWSICAFINTLLHSYTIYKELFMHVLVTGGAGFIGSHLVAALVAAGAQVRVLDNFRTGKPENLAGLPVELIDGDVAELAVVQTAVAHCTHIFHLAAMVSVPESVKNPALNHRINVTGTFNVFEAARQAGVKRVVYASSSAVYGDLPQLPTPEEGIVAPISPYGAAKWINEITAATYRTTFGLEAIGLRYMNVFGPRQDPSSPYSGVLSIFCRSALEETAVTIYGDGTQTRDFVFVEDVVQANLRAAHLPSSQLPTHPIFNVGRGEPTTINEVVEMLTELVGRPFPVTHAPERPGDIKHSLADISRAQTILGFQSQISVIDGLQQTLDWFRQAAP